MKPVAKMPNKALHRTAIPLRSIATGAAPCSAVYKFFLIRYRNTLLTIQIDGSHGEY